MNILITGGAGFICSHLTERLIGRGDTVLVIDNYSTARRDNLKAMDNLTIVEGDIANTDLMSKLYVQFQPEVVVHAAASYKDPDDYISDMQTNGVGTAVVVKESRKHEVKRLIYLQTALCYGDPQEQPITLGHPMEPSGSSYAISKTAGEYYVRQSELDHVIFRLANAYGPRNLSGPVPTFYKRLSEGKKCFVMDTRRDFIFISDMVDILEKAVDGTGICGAYHISTGKDYSIKELFDAVVKAMGITLEEEVEVRERSPDDVFSILLDPSKTQESFGIIPSLPLDEGVAKTIDYYSEYGVEETFTHLRIPGKEE
ncbi:MAG: NAD-dependent epimerase/dehydratase family protein [SAR202 cluster bacterium]|jgi:UDP-glucose 4-epimerase|nr:NAD-dependent epimerase/dehydratase family protein [SAR202 cluster bacterium]